ncbi:MAG: hypothetical protein WDW36_010294 [Sanguina aurantia]
MPEPHLAQVWEDVAAFVTGLHQEQQLQAQALEALATEAALTSAQQQAELQVIIEEADALLQGREKEVERVRLEIDAAVAEAVAPVVEERAQLEALQAILQAEVDQLRAQLEDRERHLAAGAAQVQAASEEVSRLAAAFDGMLSRLQLDQESLREQRRGGGAQGAACRASCPRTLSLCFGPPLQGQDLRDKMAAAGAEASQLQLKREALAVSVRSLSEAATEMQRGGTATRGALGREQQESLREAALRREDEEAALQLGSILSYVGTLQRELSSLTSSRFRLAADKARAEDRAVIAQRALPELEAAKKAAAQKKDFKEAALRSAESKAAQQQAHTLAAETLRLQSLLAGLAAAEEGKAGELEELREAVDSARREAGVARHRHLSFSLQQQRASLARAAREERYEDAGALQDSSDTLAAEAPVNVAQRQSQPHAQAAQRRSSSPRHTPHPITQTPAAVGQRAGSAPEHDAADERRDDPSGGQRAERLSGEAALSDAPSLGFPSGGVRATLAHLPPRCRSCPRRSLLFVPATGTQAGAARMVAGPAAMTSAELSAQRLLPPLGEARTRLEVNYSSSSSSSTGPMRGGGSVVGASHLEATQDGSAAQGDSPADREQSLHTGLSYGWDRAVSDAMLPRVLLSEQAQDLTGSGVRMPPQP